MNKRELQQAIDLLDDLSEAAEALAAFEKRTGIPTRLIMRPGYRAGFIKATDLMRQAAPKKAVVKKAVDKRRGASCKTRKIP